MAKWSLLAWGVLSMRLYAAAVVMESAGARGYWQKDQGVDRRFRRRRIGGEPKIIGRRASGQSRQLARI
jgi:hypothetical protein